MSPDAGPPAASVVIPVLNGAATLSSTLDALARQEGAPAFEVIVVDNGSRDATPEVVRRHPISATLLTELARGPYAARNAGIARAAGNVVAFTDADCIPEPGWLAAGCAALAAGADLAGGDILWAASPSPTAWERYDRATYLRQAHYIATERFAATANLFVRSEVFSRVGAFVPELTASGDLEFGRRATDAGFRIVFCPEARVVHLPRTTLRDTWALHRKLGSGFAELQRYGVRGSARSDPAMRTPLGTIVDAIARDGPPLRRRQVAHVHLLVLTARWVGRLTGRG